MFQVNNETKIQTERLSRPCRNLELRYEGSWIPKYSSATTTAFSVFLVQQAENKQKQWAYLWSWYQRNTKAVFSASHEEDITAHFFQQAHWGIVTKEAKANHGRQGSDQGNRKEFQRSYLDKKHAIFLRRAVCTGKRIIPYLGAHFRWRTFMFWASQADHIPLLDKLKAYAHVRFQLCPFPW